VSLELTLVVCASSQKKTYNEIELVNKGDK